MLHKYEGAGDDLNIILLWRRLVKRKEKSKHSLMSIFMSALGIILVGRLFMLTVAESDKWKSFAEDMSVRAVYETAKRRHT